MKMASTIQMAIDNPLGSAGGPLVPDFNIFGASFTAWWQKLFVGVWVLCIIGAAFYLLLSLTRLHKATNNNIPGQADEAKTAVGWAAGSLAALCGIVLIVGAITTMAG